MESSPARRAASIANGARSKGPVSSAGKSISRSNSYKHGMAGNGVVLPADDREKVEKIARELEAQFRPDNDVDRGLVRRAALLSVRLDQCAVRETAAISANVMTAGSDFDEKRLAEAERLMAALGDDPATSVRQLKRTPEGVDLMLDAWLALKSDIAFAGEERWGASHRQMADNLSGRVPGQHGISRVEALARAMEGDLTLLSPEEGGGLGDEGRIAHARARMAEVIDSEIARLQAHRETLDFQQIARLRGLAPDIALFDPSKPAQLARRYEAEAERGLFRAIRELRQRGKAGTTPRARQPEPAVSPLAQAQADLLGSFRALESVGLVPAPATPKNRPDPSKLRAQHDARRDRTAPDAPRDASAIVVGRG